MFTNYIYLIYMYKPDLALNNLQWLICHKTKPNQTILKWQHFVVILCKWRPDIGLAVRVFANGPGDLGSIPGRVIPKTQKMVLDASLLNTQHYKVRIKGKVEQSREGVAPSPTPWCSSYRKGSLRVTLDYGRQLYFTFIMGIIGMNLILRGYPRGVMVKAMDCGIVVRKFILQSCYYVHFRANTLGKGMNPLILPAMG